MRRRIAIAAGLATILAVLGADSPSAAYTWEASGTVAMVDATPLPGGFGFALFVGGGPCAAGSYLAYVGGVVATTAGERAQNTKATFAAIVAAQIAGKNVHVYANNSCGVEYIRIESF